MQQFDDRLVGFSQYLILENSAGLAVTKVVVPSGSVKLESNLEVVVAGSNLCDVERQTCVFEVHPRFGTLESPPGAKDSRLQLAAIYAACGTELPEKQSSRTGGEVSLELLRQSWSNKPFSEA